MAEPDVEQRLRDLELEINKTAAPLADTKVKTSDLPPKKMGVQLGTWKWVLIGVGVILGLGVVLRLLDFVLKLAIIGAIGYGVYRIAPKIGKNRPPDSPPPV